MTSLAQQTSLFEIDRELDMLLNEIQEQAEQQETDEVSPALIERFEAFCQAYSEKVDRIGWFLSLMESRANYCRAQANRLSDRARTAENKVTRTKSMVLYFLRSRDIRKIEGLEFTLRMQKNSQDSVYISDQPHVPIEHCDVEARIPGQIWQMIQSEISEENKNRLNSCIRQVNPSFESIKAANAANESVPGAEVRRGFHLRVA